MNIFRQTSSSSRNSDGEARTLLPTHSPTILDDDEVDEEYPASAAHQQEQQQTSGPSIDPYDLWKEIEASRSSAEEYVNEYLDLLATSYLDPDEDNHGPSPNARSVISRLRVFRDGALKDLRKLETQLVFAKALREAAPERSSAASSAAAIWTVACTVSAITIPARVAAGLSFFGAVAGVVALAAPPAWRSYHDSNFETMRLDVNKLRHAFEHDRPNDMSRELLRRSRFEHLRKELSNLKDGH
ncbi:hypothetical protein V8F06_010024 [Rhypophila decipiens]